MTFKALGRIWQLESGRSSETEFLVKKVLKVWISGCFLTRTLKCSCSEA